MSNIKLYLNLQQAYWIAQHRMQTNIEAKDFTYAMTFYLISLMYEDELWDLLEKLTAEDRRYLSSLYRR